MTKSKGIGRNFPKRIIDWDAVQAYYEQVGSSRQCIKHFKMASKTFQRAAAEGKIVWRPRRKALEDILTEHSTYPTNHVKNRLFAVGLKDQWCEECGITEWNGKPISFELHHCNGINNDHRFENLRILCPNCHSQTQTYKGRNTVAARLRNLRVG